MTLKNRFFALAKKHQIAVVVLLLESFGAIITTLAFAAGTISDLTSNPNHVAILLGADISLIAIFALAAASVIFISRQLVFGKRWARSAAVFWQLIQIAIAWNSFTGDSAGMAVGAWLVITAAVGTYFLFSKDVIAGTTEKVDRD